MPVPEVRRGAGAPALADRAATPVHLAAMPVTARRARRVPAAGPLVRVEWAAWVVHRAATRATSPWIPPAGRGGSVPLAARAAQAVSQVARGVRVGRAAAAAWRVPVGSMQVRRACRDRTVWLAANRTPPTGSNGINRSWGRIARALSARRIARSRAAGRSAQRSNASSAFTEHYRSSRHAGPRSRCVTSMSPARRFRLASTAV